MLGYAHWRLQRPGRVLQRGCNADAVLSHWRIRLVLYLAMWISISLSGVTPAVPGQWEETC
jgi:hypothetical protein